MTCSDLATTATEAFSPSSFGAEDTSSKAKGKTAKVSGKRSKVDAYLKVVGKTVEQVREVDRFIVELQDKDSEKAKPFVDTLTVECAKMKKKYEELSSAASEVDPCKVCHFQ